MQENNTPDDLFSQEDKTRLEYTQKIRKSLISELIEDDNEPKVPEEKSDKVLLVALLDGIDRNTLAKTKIKTEDKAARGAADSASLIASVLRSIGSSSAVVNNSGTIPVLPNDVHFEEVQGETQIGTKSIKIDEFIAEQRLKDEY